MVGGCTIGKLDLVKVSSTVLKQTYVHSEDQRDKTDLDCGIWQWAAVVWKRRLAASEIMRETPRIFRDDIFTRSTNVFLEINIKAVYNRGAEGIGLGLYAALLRSAARHYCAP